MARRFMTIKKAAEFLEVSPMTLRNWDKGGKLAAQRHPLNNYRVYAIADLESFVTKFKPRIKRKIPVIFVKD